MTRSKESRGRLQKILVLDCPMACSVVGRITQKFFQRIPGISTYCRKWVLSPRERKESAWPGFSWLLAGLASLFKRVHLDSDSKFPRLSLFNRVSFSPSLHFDEEPRSFRGEMQRELACLAANRFSVFRNIKFGSQGWKITRNSFSTNIAARFQLYFTEIPRVSFQPQDFNIFPHRWFIPIVAKETKNQVISPRMGSLQLLVRSSHACYIDLALKLQKFSDYRVCRPSRIAWKRFNADLRPPKKRKCENFCPRWSRTGRVLNSPAPPSTSCSNKQRQDSTTATRARMASFCYRWWKFQGASYYPPRSSDFQTRRATSRRGIGNLRLD